MKISLQKLKERLAAACQRSGRKPEEVIYRIIIRVNKRVRFGKPVISGTRVPVELILGKLAGGMTYEEIVEEYQITRVDILAALNYAAEVLSKEEIKAAG